MSIEVRWQDDTQSVIIYDFERQWGWADMFGAIEAAAALMDSVDHKVSVVLELTKTQSIPNINLASMQKLVTAPTASHPNMTYFYIVGAKGYIRSMLDIFGRLFPKAIQQYKIASSLADALTQIEGARQL
jgi:hypothetical protein